MADTSEMTRHALDEAVASFAATGGAVYLTRNGTERVAYATENWNGDIKMSVPLTQNGAPAGRMALGARKDGAEYGAAEQQILQQTADLMARALAIANRAEA